MSSNSSTSLKEFCKRELDRALLIFLVGFFLAMLGISSVIYLKRYDRALSEALRGLSDIQEALCKVDVEYEKLKALPVVPVPGTDTMRVMADALDKLRSLAEEVRVDISDEAFGVEVSGEGDFQVVAEILDLIEESTLPVYLIKGLSLKPSPLGVRYRISLRAVLPRGDED